MSAQKSHRYFTMSCQQASRSRQTQGLVLCNSFGVLTLPGHLEGMWLALPNAFEISDPKTFLSNDMVRRHAFQQREYVLAVVMDSYDVLRVWRNKACVLSNKFHHLPADGNLLKQGIWVVKTQRWSKYLLILMSQSTMESTLEVSGFSVLMVHKLCFEWVLCNVHLLFIHCANWIKPNYKLYICTVRVCTKNKTIVKLSSCNKNALRGWQAYESIHSNIQNTASEEKLIASWWPISMDTAEKDSFIFTR